MNSCEKDNTYKKKLLAKPGNKKKTKQNKTNQPHPKKTNKQTKHPEVQ